MRKLHENFIFRTVLKSAIASLLAVLAPAAAFADGPSTFSVRFTREAHAERFSGRVYVFFSKEAEPRRGPNWFRPGPMIAMDVEEVGPGEAVEMALPGAASEAGHRIETPLTPTLSPEGRGRKSAALVFPKGLTPDALVGLKAQAVIRFNPLEREVGPGPGNGYSDVATVPKNSSGPPLNPKTGAMEFVVDKLVHAAPIADTEWAKVLRVPSKLLSEFHGRPVELSAAVRLPAGYVANDARRYPVIYEVPGFGGTLRNGMSSSPYPATSNGVEFIHVMLDPNCPLGHHVFADSANNGPVGKALVEEFIPALDAQFRTTGAPSGRFLTGHSSGGWSSLWLQVTYPDMFNGTWSTAPDPVDFRDFQMVDLYRPGANLYFDSEGDRRPLARMRGTAMIWTDDFTLMEDVLGPGGQMSSFEAVFSRRDKDGRPEQMWNRETGAIDPAVAESWKKYDIRLVLEENWPVLGPKLKGKLHVFMGEHDTFYLEGATRLLKESLERLGSDAVVEIHPGKDHGSLMTKELKERIGREMGTRWRERVDRRE